jgi:hypothetical protein
VIITGVVSNEDADKIFPAYKTVKPYLRTTQLVRLSLIIRNDQERS